MIARVEPSDPYNLQRFIDAQDGVIETVLGELRAGSKRNHWMWFVFPQLRELGRSPNAQYFGLSSIDEASAYLNDAVLGPRLRLCVDALLPWAGRRSSAQILGEIDATKLKSSLTLFDAVEPNGIFERGLVNFYGGTRDELTLALLKRQE